MIYNIISIIFTSVKIKSRLSKYQLAILFDLVYPAGGANYLELRRGYFTNEVLAKLGISEEQYSKIRRFSYEQTIRILDIFSIEKEDVESMLTPEASKK